MPETRMPDFERRLEDALRDEIVRDRRARRGRRVASTLACGVTAVVVGAAISGEKGPLAPSAAQARPYPEIVYQPVTTSPPTDDQVGVAGAQLQHARAFAVDRHTGYVVPNNSGDWCISLPDLATDRPDVERGTTCAATPRELKRFGLAIRVGATAAAAVPKGAPAPTRTIGGKARRVGVDERGIAVVQDLLPGERFTVYSSDGASRTLAAPRIDPRSARGMCSDGRMVDRPSDCDTPTP